MQGCKHDLFAKYCQGKVLINPFKRAGIKIYKWTEKFSVDKWLKKVSSIAYKTLREVKLNHNKQKNPILNAIKYYNMVKESLR